MKYKAWAEQYLEIRRRSGDEVECLCPFHKDHRPSFYFNLKEGMWICHACGVRGNFHQISKMLGAELTEGDVDEMLQDLRVRIEFMNDEERDPEPTIYSDTWLAQFDCDYYPYYRERGISRETVEMFRLGYDPVTNSATFPLRNLYGELYGVLKRRLDPDAEPRYLEPKGYKKGDHLWGAWSVRTTTVVLTEGQFDALAMWDVGHSAVAMGGSSLTRNQVQVLMKLGITKVILCADNDVAGANAIPRVRESLKGMSLYVGQYQESWRGKDPAALKPVERLDMVRDSIPYHRWLTLAD